MVETPSALIAGTEAEISVSVVVNNTPFDNQKGTRPTMASKQYPFSSGNLGELQYTISHHYFYTELLIHVSLRIRKRGNR